MDQYVIRKYFIGGIILLVSFIIIVKLFFVQVIDSSYKLSAENNSKRIEVDYPSRGLIYDRNGKLIVYNQPSYDLMIVPYELIAFDSLELCKILDIDIQTLRDGIKKAFEKQRDPFIKQLSIESYAHLQEKLYKYPGFYVKPRSLRKYDREIAAHLLGYVQEVDEKIIEKNNDYAMGDYIGISGIERSYEPYLRGEKGQTVFLVDVHNRTKGSYQSGKYDKEAEVGKDINITIDAELQKYCEMLMKNYRGSVVVIEPSSGEILALVSSPTYNPSLFIGRERSKNYKILENDSIRKPLFNRALMAQYPPGSIFKLVNGAIALQESAITYNTTYRCQRGYHAGGLTVGCHSHPSPLNFPRAVENSCNAYFCNAFRQTIDDKDYSSVTEAYINWRNYVLSFGFGRKLNSDLAYELKGFVAPPSYYDHYYGEMKWKSLTIISLAIGQGELLTTPVQMANMAAVIANRGYYYIPHIIKKIEGYDTIPSRFAKKQFINIDSSYFEYIIEGMEKAVSQGTAMSSRVPDIIVCGKTGTAQNPQGDEHSVFVAFAPKDNPKIALSVYVEHGVWGARYAAPISGLIIEKYLKGEISEAKLWTEKRMMSDSSLYK